MSAPCRARLLVAAPHDALPDAPPAALPAKPVTAVGPPNEMQDAEDDLRYRVEDEFDKLGTDESADEGNADDIPY